jgi:hypothetical protein
LMILQRDAFAAFLDKAQFERARVVAQTEIERLFRGFQSDAREVGLEEPLELLLRAAQGALAELPFPSELALTASDSHARVLDLGSKALGSFLSGGDLVASAKNVVVEEASGRFESLRRKYEEWWERHSRAMQEAAQALQDGLFHALLQLNVASAMPRPRLPAAVAHPSLGTQAIQQTSERKRGLLSFLLPSRNLS